MGDKIIIISGTNRNDAVSLQVANIYKNELQRLSIESQIIDLKELPKDFAFTALYEFSGMNQAFNEFRRAMTEANKFVYIVPEYNGSFPGVLKTFIDGLQYPETFRDKKCALVGLSSGQQGGGLALSHLTDIFNYCGMNVLAYKPKLSSIEEHIDNAGVVSLNYTKRIRQQASKFVDF